MLDVSDRRPGDPAFTNTVIVWNLATGPADRHNKHSVQRFGENPGPPSRGRVRRSVWQPVALDRRSVRFSGSTRGTEDARGL